MAIQNLTYGLKPEVNMGNVETFAVVLGIIIIAAVIYNKLN